MSTIETNPIKIKIELKKYDNQCGTNGNIFWVMTSMFLLENSTTAANPAILRISLLIGLYHNVLIIR